MRGLFIVGVSIFLLCPGPSMVEAMPGVRLSNAMERTRTSEKQAETQTNPAKKTPTNKATVNTTVSFLMDSSGLSPAQTVKSEQTKSTLPKNQPDGTEEEIAVHIKDITHRVIQLWKKFDADQSTHSDIINEFVTLNNDILELWQKHGQSIEHQWPKYSDLVEELEAWITIFKNSLDMQ